jgi:hypothetical protein
MRYEVTTFDDSADGMERLRNQDEFILLAYVGRGTTVAEVREQFLSDIQSCARPDDFDYDAARVAVETHLDGLAAYLEGYLEALPVNPKETVASALELLEAVDFSPYPGLFDAIPWDRLEEIANDDEDQGTVTFRLYVRDTEGGDVG